MDKYDGLKLEYQLCFPLYASAREVVKKYRPLLDKLGLTYTQYITLMVLWEHKQISAKELGKKLYLDSGTLTPVLKSLESKGLIKRCRLQSDERVLLVEITRQGEDLKDQAAAIPMQIGRCMNLTPDEADQLYRLLYKVLS